MRIGIDNLKSILVEHEMFARTSGETAGNFLYPHELCAVQPNFAHDYLPTQGLIRGPPS